ncbi:MAG: hypothetical protein II139_09450 [Lachnospiraceae bacterium]|nr:hypothetical protein [Lachnospiraceae bacterium]
MKKKLIIVAAALVALILVVSIINGKFAKGVHKTFDSPKKYMAYVEKQAILGKKDNTIRSIYNHLSNRLTDEDQALEEKVTLTIGEAGASYLRLAKAAGVDLTWLQSAGFKYYVNTKDNDVEMKTTLYLNEKEIANPTVILDSNKKVVYAKIPELSKDVVKYDLEEYAEQFDEIIKKAEKVRLAYPDIKKLDKLADKYIKLALDGLENVEKDKGEFEAGDISQKCTIIRATIKEKDVKKIVSSVAKEAAKDQDLKALFLDLAKALELGDASDAWNAFSEGMTELAEEFPERELDFEKIVVELYVDGDGKIVGRTYKIVPVDGMDMQVKLGTATKGSNKGFEASFKYGENAVKLSGTGKVKGGKLSGEYALRVMGEKVVTFTVDKFDQNAWDDGYLKGHFTCELEGDLSEMMNLSSLLPYSIRRTLRDYEDTLENMSAAIEPSFDLIIDTSKNKHKIDFGVLNHDEEIFRIAFQGTMKEGSKVKIPSKAVDVSDTSELADFVDGLDMDKILDTLDSADVPKEYREIISSYLKYIR